MAIRAGALALIVALLIVFGFGVTFAFRSEEGWAGYGEDGSATLQSVEDALAQNAVQGHPRPDLNVPLAWFRTHEGRTIRLYLRAMSFSDASIGNWERREGQRTALVNSVDERQSVASGISGSIMHGCNLTNVEGTPLALGYVKSVLCSGAYRNAGIDEVHNLALVTYSPDPNVQALPCLWRHPGYDECLSGYLQRGLVRVVTTKSSLGMSLDNLILPELATGHGDLGKTLFYRAFFSAFAETLRADDQRRAIPSRIYLQVWPGDGVGRYAETIDALRDQLGPAIADWRAVTHPPRSLEWIRIAGSAGSLAILMIAALASRRIAAALPDVRALVEQPSVVRTVAWLVISFGLAEGLVRLFPLPSARVALVQLAIGAIITPLSAPLARALRQVDASLKGDGAAAGNEAANGAAAPAPQAQGKGVP